MMAQRACPFSGDLAGGGNAMKISRDAHRHLAVASCQHRPTYQ